MTMKQELFDLAAWGVQTAKAAGAEESRISIAADRTVDVSYRERKPETIKEASTKSLFLAVYVNGRFSSMSTSDLRKEALKDFIGSAVAATKLLAEDPFRTLPDPKYYRGRAAANLDLVDPDHDRLRPEDRHAMARAMEEACLAEGGDKVIAVEAAWSDSRSESVVMTSNGFDGYTESTGYSAYASMTAKDAGDRRPSEYCYASAVKRSALPPPEKIGVEAARRTLALLGAKKIKTETLPVIIENQGVSRFGDGFFQAMFGRSIQQKQSFLADKRGKAVASPLLTIVDDPLIPGGLGSRLFDGDGFAAKKRTMIEAGVLKDFYIDWYYSRKLGWEPTTGNSSNLVIPPGKRSVKEIMKDLGRGILITGFIGGNSNSTTGDASMGIFGKLFEKGEPVQAVSEMNIADNHLKFWQRLVEVGNDPWPYSSELFPSLAFKDVVISGI
jgi:PmbA protein